MREKERKVFMETDDLDRAIEALSEAYPKAFFVIGRQRKPLKHDIAQAFAAIEAGKRSRILPGSCDCRFRCYEAPF